MLDNIVLEITNFRWLVMIYTGIALAMFVVFWAATRNFKWSRKRIFFFGSLYNLSISGRISATLMLGRYLFILTAALLCADMGMYHFIVLVAFSILINILQISFKGLFGDLIVYTVVFAILVLENMLYGYYMDVVQSWVIMAMAVLLGLSVMIYSTYHILISYSRLLEREIAGMTMPASK